MRQTLWILHSRGAGTDANMTGVQKIWKTLISFTFVTCNSHTKYIMPLEMAFFKSPPLLALCQSLIYHSASQINAYFFIELAGKSTYAKRLSPYDCQLCHPCLSPLPFPQHFISLWWHFISFPIPIHLFAMHEISQRAGYLLTLLTLTRIFVCPKHVQ